MKTKKSTASDFFSDYHRSRAVGYIFPGMFALMLALSFVTIWHGGSMRGLMASVAQVATPQYSADIFLVPSGDGLDVMIGTPIDQVDTIELSLLGDPTRLHSVTSTDMTVMPGDPGVYRIARIYAGANVSAGTRIGHLTLSRAENTPVNLIDTSFISKGARYSMTNKGE